MIFSWLYLFIFLQFIYTSVALIPLVTPLAGITNYEGYTNGEGTNARFNVPRQGDISPDGTIFLVADHNNHLLRQIIISTSTVSTLAGQAGVSGITNGEGTNALFYYPTSISYSPDGSYALITDAFNNLIRKIIISTAQVTKIAGGGSSGNSFGSTNGAGTNALFNQPFAICISSDGLTAIVADMNNNMIRMIIISTSVASTLAGQTTAGSNNGIGTLAKFNRPVGVDYFPDGSAILVADYGNHLIRKIIISTAEVTTLAGATTTGSTNGIGTNAYFYYLHDIRISPDASYALVAEYGNNMIRSITLSTLFVETIRGTTTEGTTNGLGTNALLKYPRGVAIAPNGEYFIISDTENNMIRSVNILDHPTVLPRILLNYSRTTDLPTCNANDGKTDPPTIMVKISNSEAYLIVFCVVIIILILYLGGKMTKALVTELKEELIEERSKLEQSFRIENERLKKELKDEQVQLEQSFRSGMDLVLTREQEIFSLNQSLLEKDQLISKLQADIAKKDQDLEECDRKLNGV